MQRICVQEGSIKIAFLIRGLSRGGSERQLAALARGLKGMGHDVRVLVLYPRGPLESELEEAGVEIVSLEKKGRWDTVRFYSRLVREVRAIQPDILHSYLTTQNILAALARPLLRGTKIVWGVRSAVVDLSQYDTLTRLTVWIEARLSCLADLIIVNSQAGRRILLSKRFPESRIVVIPNGIDTNRFRPDPEAGRARRRSWSAPDGVKLIGLTGRIDPMKDHETFLAAASILAAKRDDVMFVCVGGGPEAMFERLRRAASGSGLDGRLVWAGEVEDMAAAHNAMDIAVLSSYGEGFPNAIGEAMACGKMSVVTEVGDLQWMVGDTGVVVPPKHPGKLAEGFERALERLEKEGDAPGMAARERVVRMFGLDAMTEQTSKALVGLL